MSDIVDPKLKISRKQLREVSDDFETIKQFEKLFEYMNELYPQALEQIEDLEARVTALENP